MMLSKPCVLTVKDLYRAFDYRGDLRKKYVMQDITEDLEDGINTDKFEIKEDGKVYCNVEGAELLARILGVNFEIYRENIGFLYACKLLTEDKIPLDVDIHLQHEDFEDFNNIKSDTLNDYISYKCVGMSLLGKRLEDIDQNLLSNRDRETINSSTNVYNREASFGKEQNERLLSAYDYIDKNDPGIVVRSLYNYDYEEIDIDEEIEKLRRMNFANVYKYLDNKGDKRLENLKNKNVKKNKGKKKNNKNKKKK